jgi:hypothetical protein
LLSSLLVFVLEGRVGTRHGDDDAIRERAKRTSCTRKIRARVQTTKRTPAQRGRQRAVDDVHSHHKSEVQKGDTARFGDYGQDRGQDAPIC